MPPRKKIEPVEDATSEPVEELKPTPINGYRVSKWVRRTAQAEFTLPGEDPLWIECNVSGATPRHLNWLLKGDGLAEGRDLTWGDVWTYLAPRVRAWNVVVFDLETGQDAIAPPPSEIGPDILAIVGADVTNIVRALFLDACLFGGDGELKG